MTIFSEALHQDLMRIGLAPNKSLANVRKMPLKREQNKTILQGTRVVRFPEFYEKALRVFWSIADVMRALPDKNVVMFVQSNKSNEWLTILFVDYLSRVGMDRLIDRVLFAHDVKASDSIVVFLDDGSYSGSQMADFLEEFMPNVHDSLVIVGIPFVTKKALEVIKEELDKHSNRLSSMILYADIMKPLSGSLSKPAIYFDHKVPDTVSTYALYDRYLEPEKTRPFYKNKNTWNPGKVLDDLPRVFLNASKIPRARMIAIYHDPARNVPKQPNRNVIAYGNLNF